MAIHRTAFTKLRSPRTEGCPRPPFGKRGSILFHCASVSSCRRIQSVDQKTLLDAIPGFAAQRSNPPATGAPERVLIVCVRERLHRPGSSRLPSAASLSLRPIRVTRRAEVASRQRRVAMRPSGHSSENRTPTPRSTRRADRPRAVRVESWVLLGNTRPTPRSPAAPPMRCAQHRAT